MLDKKVILIGYSGHGFVVADAALENSYKIIGYAEEKIQQKNPFLIPYLGFEKKVNFFKNITETDFLIGIGDNKIREKIFELIQNNQRNVVTLIHPATSISKSVIIGEGTFVNKNVSINAFAKIGKNVILNTACTVEHECVIDDSVHIAPGAVLAGNVKVGKRTFIGANTVVKQGVKIGKNVIIGAGSVIIRNIDDNSKVVGNPGRLI